jgi:beta-lactamase regulating signal transducer with metallopeptidase domain/HEAT repeat protein
MMPSNMPFSGALPLLLFVAKTTLLLVTALVATASLRRGTAGARHLVWLAALVGVLALPLLSRIQSLRLGVLPSNLGVSSVLSPVGEASLSRSVLEAPKTVIAPRQHVTRSPSERAEPVITSPADDRLHVSLITMIAIVWVVVSFALFGWLVAGAIAVRRIVAGARELTAPDWTMPLCEVADRLDLVAAPRLLLSDKIEMAFACRATDPTIVLPAGAESWSDERRRAVLFHELAHVKRHDLLGHALGRMACALYWFHPLVWTAAKQLRAESERACDDLVLTCGARPSEYAQHLLDMVTSVRNHGAPVMALPMARKKEFEGRMLAILDPAVRRASPGRAQAFTVVAMLALVSLSVAAVAPASATQAPERPAPRSLIVAAGDTQAGLLPRLESAQDQDKPHVETRTAESKETRTEMRTAESVGGLAKSVTDVAVNTTTSVLMELGRAALRQPVRNAQQVDTGRVAVLIRVLATDAGANVRKTAAWALHDISSAGARSALIKALQSDSSDRVREMSAWALGDDRQNAAGGVAAALAEALAHDKSDLVRATAAWGLGELEAVDHVSALEGAIADPNERVRQAAIWAIGSLNLRKAPPGLVNGLKDASSSVRMVTAWALGEIEDASTGTGIAAAMQNESEAKVRMAELRALSIMHAVTPAMLDSLLKSTDPEVRRRAVAMLAGSDDSWSWPWPWPQPRPSP